MKNALILRILCIVVAMPILMSICSCSGSTADRDVSSLKSSLGGSLSGSSDASGNASSELGSSGSSSKTSSKEASSKTSSATSSKATSSKVTSSKVTSSKVTSSKVTSSKVTSSKITSSKVTSSSPSTTVRSLPFSKGVNVNGMETFLSDNQWGIFERGMQTLADEFTYTNIKSQGFDHIRVPANFYTIYYEATKYGYTTEELMKCLDKAIDFCEKHGLYIVLDFHGWFYIGEEQNDIEEFLYCWTQVANRYKNRSDKLIFELLNEPWYTDGKAQPYLSDSDLNKMQADAIKIIRDTGSNNAERLIICCTADGNKAWKLSTLTLPDDDNLAVAIHEYEPQKFTGQGFTWAGYEHGKQIRLNDAGGFGSVNYDFSEIKKFMQKTGIPVVLNEFGLNLDLAHDDDVALYLSTITKFCKDNNIPWTYWHYNGGDFRSNSEWSRRDGEFALYRELNNYTKMEWDTKALDALFLR